MLNVLNFWVYVNTLVLCCVFQHPDHHALGILNGHNAMVAGSYKHALGTPRSWSFTFHTGEFIWKV